MSKIPNNFRTLVREFTTDLVTVFPEYTNIWNKWNNINVSDDELNKLYTYCTKIYPERFFDILYQNEDIYNKEQNINTDFFPEISFATLYNAEGVSESTKKNIWKYLQLMLFTVVGQLDNKNSFGETMNIFEGIDENILQEKLQETMTNIAEVFEKNNKEPTEEDETMDGGDKKMTENMEEDMKNMFNNFSHMEGIPNMENLQSHLQKLFDGKIGKLATELATEVADEFKDTMGDLENANAQDIVKKLMKNPNKIKGLMNTVNTRLNEKMKSGEISRDDIMKEAGEFLNQVKKSGGDAGVNEMLKSVMKGMGGLGKHAKINKNALNKMMNMTENKERIRKKAEDKKKQLINEKNKQREEVLERIRTQNRLKAQYRLEQTDVSNNYTFKLDGEEDQEKSFIHPGLLEDIRKEEELEQEKKNNKNKNKKKKKNKN